MKLCYVDEAGCPGGLPTPTSAVQPVLAILGIVLDAARLHAFTLDFLKIKARFYPKNDTGKHLDRVLAEVKGADLRRQAVEASRRKSRHALGVLDAVVGLLENHGARLIGRVWIKKPGAPMNGRAVYTSTMQGMCAAFQNLLVQSDDSGLVVADSRTHNLNISVAHCIFTQKFQLAGDAYDRLLEMPVFGHSDNHVVLQVADLVCSGLVFPIAAYAYCTGHVTSIHVRPEYEILRDRYGERLRSLQYRQQDQNGVRRGGITLSDPIGFRSGVLLFRRHVSRTSATSSRSMPVAPVAAGVGK